MQNEPALGLLIVSTLVGSCYFLLWGRWMLRFFKHKHLPLFSARSISLLIVIGTSNLIVTGFNILLILMKDNISCVIGTMGSYMMVSILHFPYVFRSLKHAVLSDTNLRAKFRILTKSWFLYTVMGGHVLFSFLYFMIFSSGLMIKRQVSESCGFNTYDGVYMITSLIFFVGASVWTISKVNSFEDHYHISYEIMNISLIWSLLAAPYLVFQIFLKKRSEASWFMIVMNLGLLYVSFHLPLQMRNRTNQLANHPVCKLLKLMRMIKERDAEKDNQSNLTLAQAYGDLQWPIKQMLMHEDLAEEIISVCKSFLCEENPLFLRDVVQYRDSAAKLYSNGYELVESEAEIALFEHFKQILKTYILPKAHLLVNISSTASQEINMKAPYFIRLSDDAKIKIFDKAFDEIQCMLHQNLRSMLSVEAKKLSQPGNTQFKRSRSVVHLI